MTTPLIPTPSWPPGLTSRAAGIGVRMAVLAAAALAGCGGGSVAKVVLGTILSTLIPFSVGLAIKPMMALRAGCATATIAAKKKYGNGKYLFHAGWLKA